LPLFMKLYLSNVSVCVSIYLSIYLSIYHWSPQDAFTPYKTNGWVYPLMCPLGEIPFSVFCKDSEWDTALANFWLILVYWANRITNNEFLSLLNHLKCTMTFFMLPKPFEQHFISLCLKILAGIKFYIIR
jgi:hypothetical protein